MGGLDLDLDLWIHFVLVCTLNSKTKVCVFVIIGRTLSGALLTTPCSSPGPCAFPSQAAPAFPFLRPRAALGDPLPHVFFHTPHFSSSGLKRHSVTLFEGGRVAGEAVMAELLDELWQSYEAGQASPPA